VIQRAVSSRKRTGVARRVIVPVALAVTVIGTAIAATGTAGCHSSKPAVDARSDGVTDTPLG